MTLQTAFGLKVKELRVEAMLSQIDLAKLTGIERAQISKIESGNINVTLETIEKISKALNKPVKELMDFRVKIHPFVKWAGGKTQILDKIKELMPKKYEDYYEPFIGGGALLFDIAPSNAHINDMNTELVSAYNCFKDDKLYKLLIDELNKHESMHNEEYYYKVRDMDKDEEFINCPIYIRAGRMIYLNKACFNGLYRVNSKGYFNVPFGKKEKVKTYEENNLNNIREYFENNNIYITNTDFEFAVKSAKAGDFVYFDPPYDTLDDKNSFTSYAKDDFGKDEQKRLAKVYKELSDKGVFVMLSNHNTSLINELYKDYNIHVIEARRNINSNGTGRGKVEEVIITNY